MAPLCHSESESSGFELVQPYHFLSLSGNEVAHALHQKVPSDLVFSFYARQHHGRQAMSPSPLGL